MRSIYLLLTAVALVTLSLPATTTPAKAAKVCKAGLVKATSFKSRLKTVARTRSLVAWRKRARTRHGRGFQSYARAVDKQFSCKRTATDQGRRWQCTRIGRPCTGVGRPVRTPKCGPLKIIKFGNVLTTRSSARRSARSRWSAEVSDRYGKRYSDWMKAEEPRVTCSPQGNRFRCRASARACRA